jgi:hypothetical protein
MTEDHGAVVGGVLKGAASATQFTNALMTLGDASNILRKSGSTAHHNDGNLCRVPLLQQEKQVDGRICPMTVVWALDLSRWR